MQKREQRLWCIATVSISKKEATVEDLKNIKSRAYQYRKVNGISGVSIYANGCALDLIEGLKDAVEEEYKGSIKNKLQAPIITVYDGPIEFRFFEDYIFAYRILSPEKFQEVDSFSTDYAREFFETFLSLDHPLSRTVRSFILNS